jgi:ribose transport system permease protein
MTVTGETTHSPAGADGKADDAARRIAPPAPQGRRRGTLLLRCEQFGLPLMLIGAVVLFAVLDPNTFMTTANWKSIGQAQAVPAVLGLAVMVPLVAGNFDLSVGANAIMCSFLCAAMMSRHHWSVAAAVAASVAAGTLIGAANGALVTVVRINGLIGTIGTATILQALVIQYSNNLPIASGISPSFSEFGVKDTFGIPRLALVAVGAALGVHYLLRQTPFGRKLSAIGSNRSAARLVGIRVDRLTVLSYTLAGTLAGVAGVLMVAQQGSANPSADGIGILISAITVVFLGAAAFRLGEFTVPGMLVALLLTAVLVSGLTLRGVATWVSPLCYGSALIIGMGASAYLHSRRVG